MIVLDVEQGSDEWHEARIGIPTASNFSRIITAEGKKSSQANDYINELVAEWLTGEKDRFSTKWTERGNELEPEARFFYSLGADKDVEEIGMAYLDERKLTSCSPDGLVEEDGTVEIKCPAPKTHVAYLLTGKIPAKYYPQVQGQLWIMEREWCDFVSYHPKMQPLIVRVPRKDTYIESMAKYVDEFVDKMLERRQKLSHKE